jgi:serine/threonine-protein kinase
MTEGHSERPALSRYEVLGRLASGGMGDVWLARASRAGGFAKVVALKTIRSGAASAADATQMFLREARVAAMLNHPNCVQVFDLGEEGGTYFIAMEYIDGFSLGRIARAEQPPGRRVLQAVHRHQGPRQRPAARRCEAPPRSSLVR